MCYNAVDRHVANGRADQLALIHDSAITGDEKDPSPMPRFSKKSARLPPF
jgi:hypothetical protein